jgi:uncharacterized Zn finger protein
VSSASRGKPPNPRGWYPPPSRPRPVEGGLKARSARGAIAQTWWSERFIAVLEDIGLGNRLQRGRTYARKGQVLSLDVDPGSVTAEVQGSRARPYRIRIGIPAFGKSEWIQVEQALAENAWYTAKLLSGEMPDDIEDVFAGLGLSLFPATARELTWRGREREDLLANLAAARTEGPPAADRAEQAARPLVDSLDTYYAWQADTQVPSPPAAPSTRPSTALLDQLPDTGVAVRGRPLTELLRPAYHALGDGGRAELA